MEFEFEGMIWFWRGPAPWYFVTVPESACDQIKEVASAVTYGWGMIPARVRIGDTAWATALWPKDGRYIVPIKTHVRRAESLEEGQTITVWLAVG
jgi:hypothetical protein